MRKVVVTGISAVSSLGNSFHESWTSVKKGLSGIAPLTRFDVPPMKWKMSGELKGFDAGLYLSQKEITHLDPFIHYAVAASFMAAGDARLIQQKSGVRSQNRIQDKKNHASCIVNHASLLLSSAGVIIGSSRGGITTIEQAIIKQENSGFRIKTVENPNSQLPTPNFHLSPYIMPSTSINMASSYVAQKLGIRGYCLGISNACSSGANAIGEAYRLIKSGYDGPVFAGGTEAPICRLCIEGYGVSGALSKINDASASRPFDKTRDGFVLAEGACVLVLENYESIKLALGKRAYEIPISSVKSMTGHMLAASGAFEAAVTLMTIREGIVTPTINLKTRDPECDLNYITETMKSDINTAISNSFGFGGVNAVLVFRRV